MVSVNNTKWMKKSADSHMEELCKCTSVAAFKPFSECTIKQNACATLQQRVDTGNVRICWTASRKHMSIMHVVSPLLPPPLTPDTWHPLRNLLHQLSRCDLYCHNDLGNSFVNSLLNTHSVVYISHGWMLSTLCLPLPHKRFFLKPWCIIILQAALSFQVS